MHNARRIRSGSRDLSGGGELAALQRRRARRAPPAQPREPGPTNATARRPMRSSRGSRRARSRRTFTSTRRAPASRRSSARGSIAARSPTRSACRTSSRCCSPRPSAIPRADRVTARDLGRRRRVPPRHPHRRRFEAGSGRLSRAEPRRVLALAIPSGSPRSSTGSRKWSRSSDARPSCSSSRAPLGAPVRHLPRALCARRSRDAAGLHSARSSGLQAWTRRSTLG